MKASPADVEAGVQYDIRFAGDKVGVGTMLEDGNLSGEFDPLFVMAVYGLPVTVEPVWTEDANPVLYLELTIGAPEQAADLHGDDGEEFDLEPPC